MFMNRNIFHRWDIAQENFNYNKKKIKNLSLNFGPQHPAAHGVLRLIIELSGEVVHKIDTHIGLLHRGSEKLIINKNYIQGLPYFDRFDYVSMLAQEHAYCLAIEHSMKISTKKSIFQKLRTLYDELTRILNHFMAIASHALDVGSMSIIFWAFEEREKIMEFYERICGARMHAAFYKPNDVNTRAINKTLLNDIIIFCKSCLITINEIHNVLTYNKIWKSRLINIGVIDFKSVFKYSLTGVLARGSGIKKDLRISKTDTYSNYNDLNLKSFVGINGDCYDRFLIRIFEIIESIAIINYCCRDIYYNFFKNNINIINHLNKKNKKYNNSMEKTIEDFKYWHDSFFLKKNLIYRAVESPKGEFGVFLKSDGSNKPNFIKVRSPAYYHLQYLPFMAKGHYLSDLVALIGTIDVVFGEVDR